MTSQSPSPNGEEGLFLDYRLGGPQAPQFSDRTAAGEHVAGSGGVYT